MKSLLPNPICPLCVTFVAVLFCTANLDAQEQQRTWTSANGKFEIEASLESSDGKDVKLKKANGKIVTVPLAKLSRDDRNYLKDFAKREEDRQARIEDEKLDASKFNVRGVMRIGIPEEGFQWNEPENVATMGGTMVTSMCANESGENVQLVLSAQKMTAPEKRIDFLKSMLDGVVEGQREEGFSNISVSKIERDGRRKNQLVVTVAAENPRGGVTNIAVKAKFGETSMIVMAFGGSPERAASLSNVINTAKELKGEEFKLALNSFRRIQAKWLGLSIEPPPIDMSIVSKDATSLRLQSPSGAYIFVRTMPTEDGVDVDRAWKMLQQMAIAPNVRTDKEGNGKIDGQDARYKSYFQSVGADKVWGSTWVVLNSNKIFLVTGMCRQENKDTEGKTILKSIKGIKLPE